MSRPSHLPDFKEPPLNEVVLGLQFGPVQGYQQFRVGDVWRLFNDRFPKVQELPSLQPAFETFGLPQSEQISFGIMTGALHSRYWFLSPGEDELIQFQNDRLHHNWRKIGDRTNEYPRFEKMIDSFFQEAKLLESYMSTLAPQKLIINQCEISYINHIELEETGSLSLAQNWLSFLDFGKSPPDDLSITFRRILRDKDGGPVGRLHCEASSAIGSKGQKIISLSLTARGRPSTPRVNSAIEFLKTGREEVVNLFEEVTTKEAHEQWKRIR